MFTTFAIWPTRNFAGRIQKFCQQLNCLKNWPHKKNSWFLECIRFSACNMKSASLNTGVRRWQNFLGTALQAGRSRVRYPMGSMGFFIDLILHAAIWSWVRLSLWNKWVKVMGKSISPSALIDRQMSRNQRLRGFSGHMKVAMLSALTPTEMNTRNAADTYG